MMARPKSLRTCNTEHEEHRNVPKVESRIFFFNSLLSMQRLIALMLISRKFRAALPHAPAVPMRSWQGRTHDFLKGRGAKNCPMYGQ